MNMLYFRIDQVSGKKIVRVSFRLSSRRGICTGADHFMPLELVNDMMGLGFEIGGVY